MENAGNPFANADIDLSPQDVAARVAAGTVNLVDVREQHEWDMSRIPGARHIEIERVAWNARTIPSDKPVVFQCRLGWRGGLVATAFRQIGYEAYNLEGGVQAWHDAGLPLEPEGADVSPH
jgi:hydroxyacylglutathione hydrolase